MNYLKNKYFIFVLAFVVLAGCSTTYTSLKKNEQGITTIIVSSEEEVLSAAFEAISRAFPVANIQQLSGYQTGFSWFHMPMLDRTNFRLILTNVKGETAEGSAVSGLSYSVITHGTQGLVDARYVQPLVRKFDEVLLERGIQKVGISRVNYSKSTSTKSKKYARQGTKTGTGFFISDNGYLITNYHVIESSSDISVKLHNGTLVKAVVVQSDPVNDISLLKCDVNSVRLNLSNSSTVQKGEKVLTLGYPLIGIQGQEQKATFGYVNALSGLKGDVRYMQVDVPIQPGNSGGPLIDDKGNVIGVITAMLDQVNTLRETGVLPQSVNYAMKSDYILPVVSGRLGIDIHATDDGDNKDMSTLVHESERAVILVIAK